MLTREEKYIVVSMSSPRMPDLSGMWAQYAEAIAKSKRLRTTTIKTKMRGAVIDVHGPEDNSVKNVDNIVDDRTEISILSVHINTIGISVGLMILMLCLVCLFKYLKCSHLSHVG